MNSPAFLQITPFQLPLFFFPSITIKLSLSSRKKMIKRTRFSVKCPSVSLKLENPYNFTNFTKNPDPYSADYASILQLLNPNILASLLRSCSSAKEARIIQTIIMKCCGSSVTYVSNNLISTYVKFKELSKARQVFEKMPERNVVSWTAILNGYLKLGPEVEVLRLFSELIERCVQPNASTYVCVLNLCSRRSDFELGRQIHACVIKGNWSNLIVDTAIVYFYCHCGDLSDAFSVFNRMPERDVMCWTTIITACAQYRQRKRALLMFLQMQFDGFRPNEFTVCSVLKACGEEKALKCGKQLHGAVVKKLFKEDVFMGSSLVCMYVRCEEVLSARKVFDGMPKRNTVTWTSMIFGYAQNGLGEEAISLFQKMKRRRILANSLTVVSILSACGLMGSLCTGKEIHAQILRNSIQSNTYVGSTLIWFYCKCGAFDYAARVLRAMPLRDVVSWTAIISGYARLGYGSEALECLNEMLWEGVKPNLFTYSSALKACTKLENIRQGKWIHASTNKTHGLSNVYVGSALIGMYAKCGSLVDAFRVFERMPERNLVSWKAMILGYARNGLHQEALKLMYRMQTEGIKVDDFVLTEVLSSCGDVQFSSESSSSTCFQSN